MATTKKRSTKSRTKDEEAHKDVWTKVFKDEDGNFIEAPTDESGYVRVESNRCVCASEPVAPAQEVGVLATQQMPPGGSVNWYYSGPTGATVTIEIIREAGSGAHNHGGATTVANAVGTAAPTRFVLGSNYPQNVRVVHRAPDVCGTTVIRGRFSQGSPSTIDNHDQILIAGLVPLQVTQSLKLKPPTVEHRSPYWAQPAFRDKLARLAADYFARQGKAITVTDASLQWGGRFDLRADWRPPHHEHMDGRQADLRKFDMTPQDQAVFRAIAAQVGISILEESDHWHVRG
jgi:hypothetical protein